MAFRGEDSLDVDREARGDALCDATGAEVASVVGSLSDDDRHVVADDLYEVVALEKNREAAAISNGGINAQIDYLRSRYSDDALVEIILDALDSAK